ncbi:MAG: EAL domain-containing protein, partial [Succinivibrio sp.]
FDADHFAVLAPSERLDERARQVRSIVRKFAPSAIDANIGACVWDDPFADAETACNRAKIASDYNRRHEGMYFSIFAPEMEKELEISEYVASSIDEAVSRGWIKVYYQPIIRALTGQICAMEALARWDDPVRGLLPPSMFIAPLEDARLIWKLDLCVIRQAAANIALRERQGLPEIPVSVNLSRMDFIACDIFREIEDLVRQLDIPRRMLRIEITERVMSSREGPVLKAIDSFRAAGYELWMDDFGSGYSTLNLLKDIAFDVLKLDMAFMRNPSPRSQAIVSSIVTMDKRIGNLTLAEGVETAAQAEFLRNCGCDMLQGYFFGKPKPFDEALASCIRNGISVEGARRKSYYDALGGIDFAKGVALAIVEFKDEADFRILFMNSRSLRQARIDGIPGQGAIEAAINNRSSPIYRDLLKAAEAARRTGRKGEVLAEFQGRVRLLRYKLISRCGGDLLFEVIIHDASKLGGAGSMSPLLNLRSFYVGLYAIDLSAFTIRSCQYGEAADDSQGGSQLGVEDGAGGGILPEIFPADRKRFIAFIDPQTMSARLDYAQYGMLRGIFRTRDGAGRYSWMSHRIMRVPGSPRTQALYGVRLMDVGTTKDEMELLCSDAYGQLTEGTPGPGDKAALWENLLLGSPLPLFWKDEKHRFLGASRRFLDYYGFSSQSDIIGRTDEDMRWHPGNGPYRHDEEEILRTGAMHESVPGKCIARGISHSILATKWPTYRNGRISGLMGYFLDEDMVSAFAADAKASSARLDPETGFPMVESFLDDLARYEDDCRLHGRKFGIIIIHVPEFKRIYSSFGKEAMLAAIRECAEAIRREAGPAAACSRLGTGHFAVISECASQEEAEAAAGRIQQAIGSISKAGCADCTLFAKCIVIPPGRSENFRQRVLESVVDTASDPKNSSPEDFPGSRLVQALMDDIPVGCMIIRPDFTVTFWNREAERLLGFKPEEMVGRKCSHMPLGCSFANGGPVPLDKCPALDAFGSGKSRTVEMFLKSKDGQDVLVRNTLVPVRERGGAQPEIASFFTPLSDRRYNRSLVRAIYEVATRDPVTGLPGRKYMESCLDAALENYRRTGHVFAVLFADVDDFHSVNNTFGHKAGDAVLHGIGSSLRKHGRKSDQFCRWGGDEYVGILSIRSADAARQAAARFMKTAAECRVEAGGRTVPFTVSIGIALPREGDSAISIIERADRCMFIAKKRGRGQIELDAAAAHEPPGQ